MSPAKEGISGRHRYMIPIKWQKHVHLEWNWKSTFLHCNACLQQKKILSSFLTFKLSTIIYLSIWYLEVEGNNLSGILPRKRTTVTTQKANIYINQMAFKAGLCMTRQALWQQIQLSTFQIPCSWERQHKGIATSSLHFKPNHWVAGRGDGEREKKNPSTRT